MSSGVGSVAAAIAAGPRWRSSSPQSPALGFCIRKKGNATVALSDQIAAYHDCFDLYDRAMAHAIGVRANLPSEAAARTFQLRMNYARVLQRREATRIWPKDDPKWGKSEFDPLIVRIRPAAEDDGTWWVYVERHGINLTNIEELDDETRTSA